MPKFLLTVGIICIAAALFWPILSKIPLGRLPGDIVINKPNVKIFFPITSMIVLSVVLSLILWLIRK